MNGSWFGREGASLAANLGLPHVSAESSVGSTMEVAHGLAAAGAAAGTLVVAEEQTAGRGRAGRGWVSSAGQGIWLSLVERPRTVDALDVLSLRVGLRLAPVLGRWTSGPVRLKWPNDLFVGDGKLAGVLIEARWRGDRADWVTIGVGVNLMVPAGTPAAASLRPGAVPQEVLEELVPAIRAAAFASGPLTTTELAAFAARDLASGRAVERPGVGVVRGISAAGELLVEAGGVVRPYRAGSLVFASEVTHSDPEVPDHAARR